MKQVLDIVTALEAEFTRLESIINIAEPGDSSPGLSQIRRIRALIADLKREIALNSPRD